MDSKDRLLIQQLLDQSKANHATISGFSTAIQEISLSARETKVRLEGVTKTIDNHSTTIATEKDSNRELLASIKSLKQQNTALEKRLDDGLTASRLAFTSEVSALHNAREASENRQHSIAKIRTSKRWEFYLAIVALIGSLIAGFFAYSNS